ncbi:Pentatricopeptide repeat [Thalictrum thalictroides]|uniref:Pentatricopeptide repeat n=1 Tax=Thalictrum thalictroides TaxID=46969 RepID=A0A7J6XBP4_THATH|nr:Pentatricopeptide repeat [Thalictrum thalictroides]
MIRGYSRSEYPLESIGLFKSMVSDGLVSPNNFTFPFLINACAKLSSVKSGEVIHCSVIKCGYESDIFIRNSLIHLYSNFGNLDSAQQVFGGSCVREIVSFNSMISGYARHGRPTDALRLFGEMKNSDVKPDEFTFVSLLSACSALNDVNAGKQIHILMCKNLGVDGCNVLLKSALVDMYAKCGEMKLADRVFSSMGIKRTSTACSSMVSGYARCGEIEIARCLFDEMVGRDLVSWTIMINAYTQAGSYSEALGLFAEMEGEGIKPDEVILVAALSASGKLGALCIGERIHHQYIKDELFGQNLVLATAIVDMYAKCGSIDTAFDIFNGVQEKLRTVFLYNAMVNGFAQHGRSEAAMKLYKEMDSAGLKPDEITFVGVLCACSHGGFIDEGKVIFDSMCKVHEVEPQIEHYCCLVDLLGRSGHVMDAYNFIQKMPFDANSVIWRSLLGSCHIHGNIEMGEIAAKRLLEMDPNHGARYVMLSNMLTDANRWEDAGRVRELMEDRGIVKPPGWSYIEVNGSLHSFQASKKSHSQTKEIDSMLKDMATKLKSAGYIPDTMHVLFDIDEEEKETVVSYHSEKLALAYGLINLDPQSIIRIVKNLRICGDCHSAFKLCSKLYTREIVVRDTIRFHHFKDGLCSCKDFW